METLKGKNGFDYPKIDYCQQCEYFQGDICGKHTLLDTGVMCEFENKFGFKKYEEEVEKGCRIKTDEQYKTKFTESDNVNHPAHYTDGKIEVIDYIQDKGFNFCRGNAIKYISRAGKKDKAKEIEDLQKAVWYLNKEIERLKGEK